MSQLGPPALHRSDTTSHDDPTSYTPPESFGPYRVLHQIGAGVLGPVFRTYDAENDRLVAVKALKLDLTPELQSRLVEELEAVVALELDHPSLVNMVGAGIEGTRAYVAEEYVGAESLDIALRHYAPAPLQTVLRFIQQLAGAIDFARAAGVMHGALHPRDIFLTPDQARATGFGMAHALEAVGVRPSVRRPYSAPERVSGADWGTETDVYALAAITYELLTAKRIAGAGGQSAGSSPEAHANVYPAILDVLETALAADPRRRYPSALVLVAALTKAMASAPPVEASASDVSDVPTPSRAAAKTMPKVAPTTSVDARKAATNDSSDEARQATAQRLFPSADEELEPEEQRPMREVEADDATVRAQPPTSHATDRSELLELELASAPDARDESDSAPRLSAPSPVSSVAGSGPQFDRVLDDMTGSVAAVRRLEDDRDDDDTDDEIDEREEAVERTPGGDRERFDELADAGHDGADDDERDVVDDADELRADGPPWAPAPAWGVRRWPGGQPRSAANWSTAVLGSAAAVALLTGFILGYLWNAPGDGASDRTASAPVSGAAEATVDGESAPASIVRAVGPDVAPASANATADPTPSAAVPLEPVSPPARPVRQEAPTSSQAGAASAVPQSSNGPVVAASNRDGRLLIRTTPAGATVTIDGHARGTSPLVVRDLEYGAYAVGVSLPGFATQTTRMTVTRERPASSVTLELLRRAPQALPNPAADEGALFIDSRPRGARVIVDEQSIGTTPMQMLALPAGTHEVRLELNGYRVWTSTVQVRGGETSRVTGSLDQRP